MCSRLAANTHTLYATGEFNSKKGLRGQRKNSLVSNFRFCTCECPLALKLGEVDRPHTLCRSGHMCRQLLLWCAWLACTPLWCAWIAHEPLRCAPPAWVEALHRSDHLPAMLGRCSRQCARQCARWCARWRARRCARGCARGRDRLAATVDLGSDHTRGRWC